MSASLSCDKEAQFLKAHNARTDALRNTDRQSKARDLSEFWKALHGELASWKEGLDQLQPNPIAVSAAQRNEARLALEAMSDELRRLRKQCLADLEMIDLPVTDVRLLHEEFMKHSALLEAAREKLCPPSKFVFKRYRAAMMLKENNQKPQASTYSKIIPAVQQSPDAIDVKFGGTVIREHSDAIIEVQTSGDVRIKNQKDETIETNEGSHSSSASVVLQNLVRCDVSLNGTFQAVHIQQVESGSIKVVLPIGGACHITSCHHLQLTLESHQLRIHESSDLNCFVRVRSCPILEDCTRIEFHYDAGDKENAVPETKDFNWLRNGIPSPNFSLVPIESSGFEYKAERSGVNDISEHTIPALDANQTKTTVNSDPEDDDEL